MSYSVNINSLIKESWELFKNKIWAFVGILAIMWVINVIPSSINNALQGKTVAVLIVSLAFAVPQIILSMGVIKYTLTLIKENDADFGIIFTQFAYFWKFVFASIIYNVIVGVGLLLLVFPGIYLGIRLQFFSYLIVDQGLGPIEAIKTSFAITQEKTLDLFLLALVAIGVNLLGAMAFGLGLLVTVPVTMIMYAKVYKSLSEITEA